MTEVRICNARRLKDQQASYDAAIEENPDNAGVSVPGSRRKRAVGHFSMFWANGRTLKIGFTDDTLAEDHKQAIIEAINQWQPYVNLTFEFIDGREGQPGYGKGDIRITTRSDQNYTLIGTDAKANDPWNPTMVLGAKLSDPKFQSIVMHEFGHALGAEHEHQHPEADIPWDVPKVYEHYAASGVEADLVDEVVLSKFEKNTTTYTAYDKHSIMHYPVPNKITLGDWEVGLNTEISDKDKAFMRKAYPKI
jgi:Astacin (Peptidase family M12A)